MEKLEAVPHFIEPGDEQDVVQALSIFVTRQADDATRTLQSNARRVLQEAQNNPVERPNNG